MENLPIRIHSIWPSLAAWHKGTEHLLTREKTDFPTWYEQFKTQSHQHHLPASISWRMAKQLLPQPFQLAKMQRIQEKDSCGFNSRSSEQLVNGISGGKDFVILATEQVNTL